MLPAWFAEYTVYLGLAAILLFLAVIAFGWIAASKGRFTDLLSDAHRTRRPSALIAAVGGTAGVVVATLAFISSDSHLRLVLSALATVLVITAVAAAGGLPVRRLWTNEYWGLPPADTMTAAEADTLARTMGRIYAVSGLASVIAVTGALIGVIPKLVYVGEAPIPAIFLIADFAVILVGAAVAFQAWRLFQSVRIHRAAAR